MKFDVVAEKIEDEATLSHLRKMGVRFGQGFYLHRPEPLADIVSRRFRDVLSVGA